MVSLIQFGYSAFLIDPQMQSGSANSTIDITLILSTLGDGSSITVAALKYQDLI